MHAAHRRGDSEYLVDALYNAILDRDPDAPSWRSAVAEVQRGNMEGLIDAMVRSQEFGESRNDVPPGDLLDRFYLGIFDRLSNTSVEVPPPLGVSWGHPRGLPHATTFRHGHRRGSPGR